MKGYYHYVEDVLNGKIVVGELIKISLLEIQRRPTKRGYLF